MQPRRSHSLPALVIGLAALSLGPASVVGDEAGPGTAEPQAPDVLELVQIAGSEAKGSITLEAVLRPTVDAEVELEVLSPVGLHFASSRRSARYQLRRGGVTHRERLEVDLSGVTPIVVRVRAHLLNDAGERWMNVDREMTFKERSVDLEQVRVPVVRTAVDGSRIVEYMDPQEAKRHSGMPTSIPVEELPQTVLPPGARSLQDDDPPSAPVIQE